MAVAVQLDFRGATLDQYDEMTERIGVLPGGPALDRELFHWVAKTNDGFHVVDVWESREAFEDFERGRLSAVYKEVGILRPPDIQFFDVYNYLAGGRQRG